MILATNIEVESILFSKKKHSSWASFGVHLLVFTIFLCNLQLIAHSDVEIKETANSSVRYGSRK